MCSRGAGDRNRKTPTIESLRFLQRWTMVQPHYTLNEFLDGILGAPSFFLVLLSGTAGTLSREEDDFDVDAAGFGRELRRCFVIRSVRSFKPL